MGRCLDYFRLLYHYIQSHLQNEVTSEWDDAKIEYIFSVPTTWQPHPTVERFRKITERAGFGRSPNHISVIGLTEAEAAAVFMSKEERGIFKEDEILMVCDLGGGTSVCMNRYLPFSNAKCFRICRYYGLTIPTKVP